MYSPVKIMTQPRLKSTSIKFDFQLISMVSPVPGDYIYILLNKLLADLKDTTASEIKASTKTINDLLLKT